MLGKILHNQFFKNSLILFIGSMTVNVLNYFFHLVIGRSISIENYGAFESLNSLILIISVPGVAISMLATKFSAAAKAENDWGKSQKITSFIIRKTLIYSLPLLGILFLSTPWIQTFLKIKELWPIIIVWLILLFYLFYYINIGVLSGWQKFSFINYAGIGGAIIKLVSGIMLVKLGWELTGPIGGFLLGVTFSYILSTAYLRNLFRTTGKIDKVRVNDSQEVLREIKNHAGFFLFANLALNILGNADMFIAKHNLTDLDAGYYGALTIASKTIFFATSIIATVIFSMSSEETAKKVNSFRLLNQAVGLMGIFLIISLALFSLFPQEILALLFGSKYQSAASYLGWFGLMASLYSINNLLAQYLLSTSNYRETTCSLFIISLLTSSISLLYGQSVERMLIIFSFFQLIAILYELKLIYYHEPRKNN